MTRVLLVEDSADVLEVLQLELEGLGYEVLAFIDAREALKVAHRLCPDVIVSDLRMPGLDGFEFIKRIRKKPRLASIPAVALTGTSMEKEIQEALASGFTTHITKPMEARELAKRIDELTAARRLRQAS
jgi:two-component system, chemotaxis family, CheB/CheR fusion protein